MCKAKIKSIHKINYLIEMPIVNTVNANTVNAHVHGVRESHRLIGQEAANRSLQSQERWSLIKDQHKIINMLGIFRNKLKVVL